MLEHPACPEDSGHIHEARFIPNQPGVIPPPPPPDPDGGPPKVAARKKQSTSEGADEAPSVVKETD